MVLYSSQKKDNKDVRMQSFFLSRFLPLICYLIVFVLVLMLNASWPILTNILLSANWLAIIACIILFFGKKHNIQIRSLKPSFFSSSSLSLRAKRSNPYLKIIILQFLLFVSYLICLLLFYKLIFPNADRAQWLEDSARLFKRMSYAYGLFPWMLYAVLTLSFAYRYFNEKKRISLSRIIRYLVPHRQVGIISIGAHIYFRYITMLAIGLSIMLFTLYATQQLLQFWHVPIIDGMNVKSLFVMSVLTMPLGMAWGVPTLRHIYQKFHLGSLIVILLVFFIIVLAASSILFFSINKYQLTLNYTLPFPTLAISNVQQLIFFSFCWWMGFALPFCWCLARLVSGKTIRTALLMLLIFPLCLSLLLLSPPILMFLLRGLERLGQVPSGLMVGILFCVSFFSVFYGDKRNLFGICSLTQKRLSYSAYRTFIQNSIFILSVFLMTRFFMLYYFVVVMVIMGLIYLLSCVLSFLKHLYFD